jgi:hypothetical protein
LIRGALTMIPTQQQQQKEADRIFHKRVRNFSKTFLVAKKNKVQKCYPHKFWRLFWGCLPNQKPHYQCYITSMFDIIFFLFALHDFVGENKKKSGFLNFATISGSTILYR